MPPGLDRAGPHPDGWLPAVRLRARTRGRGRDRLPPSNRAEAPAGPSAGQAPAGAPGNGPGRPRRTRVRMRVRPPLRHRLRAATDGRARTEDGAREVGAGRPRRARLLVLLAAFVCAACGLVYELELVAVGGYLLGDSVTQTSVVLSLMVFAMGIGSLAAKRLTHRPATSFALVECALAVVGGLSVLALYACWAWLGRYQLALAGLTCVIGLLIGAEIPLLMTLVQRIRREEAGRAAADLFAADYVGALVGGLAFPFLLLPQFGQAGGALLTGAVNALAGAAVVLWLFRDEPAPRTRLLLWTGCGAVLATLALAAACTGAIERAARHALYGAEPRRTVQGRYGEIVLTGPRVPAQGGEPLRLYLDGRLAACGSDEYRYHEALVHPAVAGGADTRVLLLGGGDGLALREVLRHAGVASVLVVSLDPALPELARTDPALAALSDRSLDDPRVRLVTADPLAWLRAAGPDARPDERFDAVLADLPAPQRAARAEYHSAEFYGLAAARLAAGGRLAVPAPTGPGLWTVEAGLRSAGLFTVPFPVPGSGPACDPAGSGAVAAVLLAARDGRPELALAADAPAPRSLTGPGLRAAAAGLAATRPTPLPPPSTLLDPR
ncbi:spermidine synthase [Kitasatospora viridis]|uniref:Polyamine aminopropyltransferase n=2 Tax=Kitasatospora viridis TaxID=281105 RepID=A0A561UHQ0_9ACTN|nr:spermidine synthase [Kitasatospora viridis]